MNNPIADLNSVTSSEDEDTAVIEVVPKSPTSKFVLAPKIYPGRYENKIARGENRKMKDERAKENGLKKIKDAVNSFGVRMEEILDEFGYDSGLVGNSLRAAGFCVRKLFQHPDLDENGKAFDMYYLGVVMSVKFVDHNKPRFTVRFRMLSSLDSFVLICYVYLSDHLSRWRASHPYT
jgi:hypothetical protein